MLSEDLVGNRSLKPEGLVRNGVLFTRQLICNLRTLVRNVAHSIYGLKIQ